MSTRIRYIISFLFPLLAGFAYWYLFPALDSNESVLGQPFGDARAWFEKGIWLSTGKGLHDNHRPGYSLLLAIWFSIFPATVASAKCMNIIMYALAHITIYEILRRAISEKLSLAIVIANSLIPINLRYTAIIQSEIGGLLFSAIAILFYCDLMRNSQKSSAMLSGVAFGLSNITRPLSLTIFPILMFLPFLRQKFKCAALLSACFMCGCLLIVSPWLIRQKIVYGIATISNSTAENFYAATSSHYRAWSSNIFQDLPSDWYSLTPALQYDYFMTKGTEQLINDPLFYLQNAAVSSLKALAAPYAYIIGEGVEDYALLVGICVLLLIGNLISKCADLRPLLIYYIGCAVGLGMFGMTGLSINLDARSIIMYSFCALLVPSLTCHKILYTCVYTGNSSAKLARMLKIVLSFITIAITTIAIRNISARPIFGAGIDINSYKQNLTDAGIVIDNPVKNLAEYDNKLITVTGWLTQPVIYFDSGQTTQYNKIYFQTEDFARAVFVVESSQIGSTPVMLRDAPRNLSSLIGAYETPIIITGTLLVPENFRVVGNVLKASAIYNVIEGKLNKVNS